MSDFFSSFFCCSNGDKVLIEEEEERNKLEETEKFLSRSECPIKSVRFHPSSQIPSIIDNKYLFSQEKNFIFPFTKDSILSFFAKLEKTPKTMHLYKSDNLNFYVNKEGSLFSPDVYMCTTEYSFDKKDLYQNSNKQITLEQMGEVFNDPELRKKWDTGVFQVENILQFDNNEQLKSKLFHVVFNSPVFGIDKREMVDKIITFNHNGTFYCYQAAIEEDIGKELVEVKEGIIRAFTYINSYKMWEDKEKVYLVGYYQCDFRVSLLS